MKAELGWLDDPRVFRVNQLPAHSDIVITVKCKSTIVVMTNL